jgi:hypothetical protein
MWASFREVSVLRKVEEERGTGVRRIAAAGGIGVPLVWRIIHEKLRYPYHIERVEASKCKFFSPSCKGGALPVASRKNALLTHNI